MEEAKNFIIQKFQECVLFKHENFPTRIYHIWDKQLMRQRKLLRLSGLTEEINFYPNKNSIILFEQDDNRYLWYSYTFIYSILNKKFLLEAQEINELFYNIFENNLNLLLPLIDCTDNVLRFEQYNKFKKMKLVNGLPSCAIQLKDETKWIKIS